MASEQSSELAAVEERLLSGAGMGGAAVSTRRLELPENKQTINYFIVGGGEQPSSKPACVLVHGFGCGVGCWAANTAALAANFVVYAVDLPGFGRSSRPDFSRASGALAAEDYFVLPLERWREALCRNGHTALEKPTWIGHSLGGFVVSCYALRFPSRVQRLVLVDAWGLHDVDEDDERCIPLVLRSVVFALPSPLSPIRWLDRAGGLGKPVLSRVKRTDFQRWNSSVQRAASAASASPDDADATLRLQHLAGADHRKQMPDAPMTRERSSHWRWCADQVRSLVSLQASNNDMTDYLYSLSVVPAYGGEHAFKVCTQLACTQHNHDNVCKCHCPLFSEIS
jgi:pimeloyl-ACP methyl ester carboxylesterase